MLNESVALMVNSLSRAEITTQTINDLWLRNVVPQAVDALIGTVCFGYHMDADETWLPRFYALLNAVRRNPEDSQALAELEQNINPQHRHCFKLWLEDGDQGFFCLGPVNRCINCEAEWVGLVNINWQTGALIKGACPSCGSQFEALTNQREEWQSMIAALAGEQIVSFDKQTTSIKVGLQFKLAEYYMNIQAYLPKFLDAYNQAQEQLVKQFVELGLRDSAGFNACQWAVWARLGFQALGLDWTDSFEWSYNQKRERVSVLVNAARVMLSEQQVDQKKVKKILSDQTLSDKEKWEDLYTVARTKIEEKLGEPNERFTVPAVEFHDSDYPDRVALIVWGDANVISRLRRDVFGGRIRGIEKVEGSFPWEILTESET